jgi:hypothetical protein
MSNYDSVEEGLLMEGMTSEQKWQFHREMSEAWRDPKRASRFKWLLGGIGAHHFYLGDQGRGIKYLLFAWTGIPALMCIFEGDIKKRTQRVNSDIAMRLAMRIKGGGATPPMAPYSQYPPTTPGVDLAPPIYVASFPTSQQPQLPPQAEMTTFCVACGNTVEPGARFCNKCGAATTPKPEPPVTNDAPSSAVVTVMPQPQQMPSAVATTAAPGPSSAKRWVLIGLGVIGALFLATIAVGLFVGHAKETDAASVSKTPNVSTPAKQAVAPIKTPDVQVYSDPSTADIMRSTGLTDEGVRNAVLKSVVDHHISIVAENAVFEDADDWVSVRLSADASASPPDAPLIIEMSVRNGPSVNNQLIRWEGRKTVRVAESSSGDVLGAFEALVTDLAVAYNTPAYRQGTMAVQ